MNYQEMYDYLMELSERGAITTSPDHPCEGLCVNFDLRFEADLGLIVDFSKYPRFSGDKTFPLKGGKYAFYNTYDMWGGAEGFERRRFCEWCAREIKRKFL